MNIVFRKAVTAMFLVLLAACAEQPAVTNAEVATYGAAFQDSTMTSVVQEKWARSCALCHVSGEGGAPRMGEQEAWAPRREKGNALMLKHTLEGLNRMPPLGYCMDCELADFAAMIELMAGSE